MLVEANFGGGPMGKFPDQIFEFFRESDFLKKFNYSVTLIILFSYTDYIIQLH